MRDSRQSEAGREVARSRERKQANLLDAAGDAAGPAAAGRCGPVWSSEMRRRMCLMCALLAPALRSSPLSSSISSASMCTRSAVGRCEGAGRPRGAGMRLNVLSPTLHRVEPYFLECSAKLCSPAWGANTGERVKVKEPTVALQIQSGAFGTEARMERGYCGQGNAAVWL